MTGFWLKRRLLRTGVWLLVALLTAGLAFSMGILRRAHEEQQKKLSHLAAGLQSSGHAGG